MAYPEVTTLNLSKGMGEILNYVNTVTNFWFGRILMMAIFVIFFVGYLRSKQDEDFVGSFAIASYVTLVIGVLFWIINFLDGVAFGIIIALAVISSLILFLDKRGEQ